MKKILLTFLTILILFELSYSQKENFYLDKKLSTWEKINSINIEMNSVSFSIDEKHLAAAGTMGSLIIWNLENGNIEFNLSDTSMDISYLIKDVDYSPDGKYLATVGTSINSKSKIIENNRVTTTESEGKAIEKKVLRIYETKNYSIIKEISYDTIADMYSCVFTSDSKYLITGENQSTGNIVSILRAYETNSWKETSKLEIDYIPWDLTLNKSGEQLYLPSNDGFLSIYDFKNGKLSLNQQIKLKDYEIKLVSISPNNQTYYVYEDTLYLYNPKSKESTFINYHEEGLFHYSISPDKVLIAFGGLKNDCFLYNSKSKKTVQVLQGDIDNAKQNEYGENITKPIFSYSGKIMAMLNDSGFIYIFRKK